MKGATYKQILKTALNFLLAQDLYFGRIKIV
jgi:hypothetical protein